MTHFPLPLLFGNDRVAACGAFRQSVTSPSTLEGFSAWPRKVTCPACLVALDRYMDAGGRVS